MREFLNDADQHRDAGLGRAQKSDAPELPKRFYKQGGVAPAEGGFAVTLDGHQSRTPSRTPVIVPASGIATTMAAEWDAQGEHIDPRSMPTVRLINAALEAGSDSVPALRDEIVKYAANDLLLYRADAPQQLVDDQDAIWDAALVALARHFGIKFQPTIGIVHQKQPDATLARLAEALQDQNVFVLTALNSITGITGSGLLAIGLWNQLFTPDHVWVAAHVDEDFQARQWGEVDEAVERRAQRRLEYDAAVYVLEQLRG